MRVPRRTGLAGGTILDSIGGDTEKRGPRWRGGAGTPPFRGVVLGDLALMPPRSMAGTGQARVVSARPSHTLSFQNTCHVLNFIDFAVLKFNFAVITFIFKALSSPL